MRYLGKIQTDDVLQFCWIMDYEQSNNKFKIKTYLAIQSDSLETFEKINRIRWETFFDKSTDLARQYCNDLESMGLFKLSSYQSLTVASAFCEMQGNLFGISVFKMKDQYIFPIIENFSFSPRPRIIPFNKSQEDIIQRYSMQECIDDTQPPSGFSWEKIEKDICSIYDELPSIHPLRYKGCHNGFLSKSMLLTNFAINKGVIKVPECIDFVDRYPNQLALQNIHEPYFGE